MYELAKISVKTMYKDCQELPNLLPVLHEIDAMVGLKKVKDGIADRIMFYCQRHKFNQRSSRLNHMILVGPPGCGKTTLANNIAKLFCRMGKIKRDKVVVGNRKNMIGSYLGQTAKNTQEIIDSALGGVLLIDEAYSLGDGRSSDSSDSFSKACIDTLNQNLTEKGDKFICIIIGYKDQLERDFFSTNPGLKRRFPYTYELEKYTHFELGEIFHSMCKSSGLVCDSMFEEFFKVNYSKFKHHAASMKELVEKLSLVICRRCFGSDEIGVITLGDMNQALCMIDIVKDESGAPSYMYM